MCRQCERVVALQAKLREVEVAYGALAAYFGHWSAEHEDPDCPEDDTCSCPLVQGVNRAMQTLKAIASSTAPHALDAHTEGANPFESSLQRWATPGEIDPRCNCDRCPRCGHSNGDHRKPMPFRDGTCQWMGCRCVRSDPLPPIEPTCVVHGDHGDHKLPPSVRWATRGKGRPHG